MQLRKEQFDLLCREAYDRQLRAWARELRKNHPEKAAQFSEGEFEKVVSRGVEAASAYGMRSSLEIRECLRIMVQTGINTDGQPRVLQVREILSSADFSPVKKLAKLAILLPDDPDTQTEDARAIAQVMGGGAGETREAQTCR
jgi:hypothetical protein